MKYYCRSSLAAYTLALDSSSGGHDGKNRNMEDVSRNFLFLDESNLRTEVVYEAKEDFSAWKGGTN